MSWDLNIPAAQINKAQKKKKWYTKDAFDAVSVTQLTVLLLDQFCSVLAVVLILFS